eukprot:TRINITY_DN3535_c0_g1_i2.p1 TRINITY_DN3535_c0_g1~~TRINITY_DN3535_c0_g1_i2.p1  ORF type:complete len:408 (-),score=45.14 TRINITY_DN3535_c0_g1_i2:464-1687(-)
MSYNLPLTGGLNDRRGSLGGGSWNGKKSGKFGKGQLQPLCQVLCAGQTLLGLVAAFASMTYLYSFLRMSGLLIAVFLIVVGCLGFLGSVTGNRALLTSHMVAITLAMMITFDFNAQVTRDAFVDCSLAELYQRNSMLSSMVQQSQKNELVSQIFLRLNEMEDLINVSHESAVASMTIKQQQQNLRTSDIDYVRSKLEMMKEHAQHLMDELLNNPDVTQEWVNNLSDQQKEVLNNRIEAAENVINKVEALQDPNHKITLEEYQSLLTSLTQQFQIGGLDVDKGPRDATELLTALNEMDQAKDAYQRLSKDKYHDIKIEGEASEFLDKRQKQLEERRKKWQDKFISELKKVKTAQDQAGEGLADLPEHCLMEQSAKSILTWSALGLVLLQLCSGICVLTLLFSLPKKDY